MNANKRTPVRGPIRLWLASAGVAVSLMIPLSASADHGGNGAAEVLISAAVAYAVIDTVGGFDNGNRHDRRHRKHGYRHGRHGRYNGHRDHGRRHWARHDHRRCDRHGYHYKHRLHHGKHRAAHRRSSDRYHHRRDDRRYRSKSYH